MLQMTKDARRLVELLSASDAACTADFIKARGFKVKVVFNLAKAGRTQGPSLARPDDRRRAAGADPKFMKPKDNSAVTQASLGMRRHKKGQSH